MVDAVADLVRVRCRIVEVSLEESRIGDAADLADALLIVEQLPVRPDFGRRALLAVHIENLHVLICHLADAAARVALATEGADRRLGRAIKLENVLEAHPEIGRASG